MIKVLLVEDEVGTRNLLRIIVNWEEFHMKIIGEAPNGREALFRIQRELPDLVVTDIKMPIMDGIALAEEIMEKYPSVKVIIVTAYDDFKYAQKALRAGAVDFILKPLKRQEVKDALLRVGRQIETVEEDAKDVIEQIRDYVEENYAQSSLSLSMTAEKFYLNSSYLSRAFRKKTGIPFVEYLNKVRIELACDYLKSGNWKVYEIAEKVGIPNPDYFSRCFRKYIGMSTYTSLKEVTVQTSAIDGTKKFLFELADGNLVESVWMQYHHGNSVCISSQVGCRMGCRFCASTLDGLERSLLPGEMLDQIYAISRSTGERVSNVVVMGTGEPMDNYDNLLQFIRMLSDENGLNISQRNITVSTCGIVENMRRLADEGLQITLALSLHGSTQQKRQELMPIANKYDIHEVIDACRYYFDKTGRRVTFEYSLVGGVNDTDEDAENLSNLIQDINCHVNLIPVNPIKERDYVESERSAVLNFQNKLTKRHINATVRREMGRDIDGACGQLRRRKMHQN